MSEISNTTNQNEGLSNKPERKGYTRCHINSNNASSGGIGILIDNNSLELFTEIIKWNNRILLTNFHGNRDDNYLALDHHTHYLESKQAQSHYEELTKAYYL